MAKEFLDENGLRQVETENKKRYKTLNDAIGNKVEKADGKDLVSNTDINQITTNKNNISNLTTRVTALETNYSNLTNKIAAKLESLI